MIHPVFGTILRLSTSNSNNIKEEHTMKKLLKHLLPFILILSLMMIITGCSAKKSESAYNGNTAPSQETAVNAEDRAQSPDPHFQNSDSKVGKAKPEESQKDSNVAGDSKGDFAITTSGIPNNILGDRKIIFNAFLSLEVEDFDTKVNMIKSLVQNTGTGYLQSSDIRAAKISSNPEKYRKEGTLVLRVAQSKFHSILNEIEKMGTVTNNRIGTEEITDQYFDTKYRVQMFEAERERVMEYLKKASDLNTMLQLERKLSEITYEIERLKGTLRKWDNLVEFSTITIDIREKVEDDIFTKNKTKAYGERLLNALVNSFADTINALGDFLVLLISLLPTFIILSIIYLVAKPFIYKLTKKKDISN